MSEWKECKLGDVITLKRGFDLPSQERKLGSVPIFSSSGVTGFNSEERAKGPGVITGRYGTIGEVFYTEGTYWPLNTTLYVKDFKCNFEKYIYYLLKNFNFNEFNDKSVVPGINRNHVHEAAILLPPLPEQHAIAAVLSSLDDKIDLLHRQNRTLEAMAETLFRQWFIEDADEEWEEGKVLDYCTHYKMGVNPQDMPTEIFSHYSIPAFDNNMNPVIERGTEIQSNKYSVVPNCLLFSKLNPNKDKRIWLILDLLSENPVCSTEFQVVLPRNNKYLFFIYSWLSISHNYNEIASGVGGTSGSHQRIDPADLFNFPCPRIEDSYISAYNEAVAPLFFKMNKNRFQIRTLEKLRDTLLPRLMSGDVRVAL